MQSVSHESRMDEGMPSQTYVYSAGSNVCQVMSNDENMLMKATTRAMLTPQALTQTQHRVRCHERERKKKGGGGGLGLGLVAYTRPVPRTAMTCSRCLSGRRIFHT